MVDFSLYQNSFCSLGFEKKKIFFSMFAFLRIPSSQTEHLDCCTRNPNTVAYILPSLLENYQI
jgi:hypothetical protein